VIKTRVIPIALCLSIFAISAFVVFNRVSLPGVKAQERTITTRNTTNVDEASNIAGYKIASPSYIPDGFKSASELMINKVGVSDSSFNAVTRVWEWTKDTSIHIILTQTPVHFDIGGGTAIEINGKTVQKAFIQDIDNPDISPELSFAWEQGGSYFELTGSINGPLNENTMQDIMASIK
jgi:hypothetical protein